MVCVTFQLVFVKVKLVWFELTSSVGFNAKFMITSLNGCVSKTKVKLAVCVDASVKVPVSADRVNPGVSLSRLFKLTVWVARPVKAASDAELILAMMETTCVPSTNNSSTEVRVTVCAVFQLEGVNVRLVTPKVTSVVSKLCTSTITLVKGAAVSTTETVAVCAFPSVKEPDTVPRLKPATSSSKI